MAHRVPITIRTDHFEGPLDLLLYLIQSSELDISRISLAKITDQYLLYVRLMQELNFDVASEFLVLAATLVAWKSKALLPREDDGQEAAGEMDDLITQEELIRRLLMHQQFLAAGEDLAGLPKLGEDVFKREVRRLPTVKVWRDMSLSDLTVSYQDMLIRQRRRTRILKKETVSVAEKVRDFASQLEVGKPAELRSLMGPTPVRGEVVVTFLASLELSRLKKLKVYQDVTYAPIYVELLENIDHLMVGLITDFDQIRKPTAEAGAAGGVDSGTSTSADSGTASDIGSNIPA